MTDCHTQLSFVARVSEQLSWHKYRDRGWRSAHRRGEQLRDCQRWSTLNDSYFLLETSSPYLTLGINPAIHFRGSRLSWQICNYSDADYTIEDGVLLVDSVASWVP